ncbi:hypothetical protein PSTT_00772 [Puccinia striiformis]|uniref:Alpha-type protein kinase domain-containing protein n=1 Tax=Puccinia striiformis TaxID=27350 RepID=A0A2S4W5N1_9BASI|nr:hypothetical protein PSTT_00772 [Puccinia striiformis]
MDMVSRLGQLSKNISRSSLVPLSEWITGNRLDFFTSTSQPDTIPPSTRFQLANGIQGNTHPICYRINLNEKLGEGSMRKAYATEAFGHLLERYKEILMHCPSLNNHFKLKAQQISLVCHAVIATGPVTAPTNNQPGMDMELFQIMDAFTHWTYNQSSGKYL